MDITIDDTAPQPALTLVETQPPADPPPPEFTVYHGCGIVQMAILLQRPELHDLVVRFDPVSARQLGLTLLRAAQDAWNGMEGGLLLAAADTSGE